MLCPPMTNDQTIAAIVRLGTARRSLEAIHAVDSDSAAEIAVLVTRLVALDRKLQKLLETGRTPRLPGE
jgi:hypothetical protein